ncbi:MAG: ClbS/DfsB family four-helix bundle protein [Chloroflexi bacterium]|nr:ClbS/DfsB family four-helix bundle protein [Chloroflexota bacterium]
MKSTVKETRHRMMELLDETRRETQFALSDIDPEQVVHGGNAPWRVRDVIGHLGVWNGEAAQSLRAHAAGHKYHCISSEAKYEEYNGAAVGERRTWSVEQVWAEYKTSHDQLKSLAESMSNEAWDREMLYPWNEEGAPWRLIEEMMKHEEEHREAILAG